MHNETRRRTTPRRGRQYELKRLKRRGAEEAPNTPPIAGVFSLTMAESTVHGTLLLKAQAADDESIRSVPKDFFALNCQSKNFALKASVPMLRFPLERRAVWSVVILWKRNFEARNVLAPCKLNGYEIPSGTFQMSHLQSQHRPDEDRSSENQIRM
eukprot:jgi/Bigna1/141466/aug1.62_g16174